MPSSQPSVAVGSISIDCISALFEQGSLRPLVRRGPVSPNDVLEKKKRCARSARAADTLLTRQNCDWGSLGHMVTPPAAVFCLYLRLTTESGVPPLTISQKLKLFSRKVHNIFWSLPLTRHPTTGYSVRLSGLSSCLLKWISWVQFWPSAHTRTGLFLT